MRMRYHGSVTEVSTTGIVPNSSSHTRRGTSTRVIRVAAIRGQGPRNATFLALLRDIGPHRVFDAGCGHTCRIKRHKVRCGDSDLSSE